MHFLYLYPTLSLQITDSFPPLFLTFKSFVYTSLHTRCPSQQPHTLSLVPSCLCHCLHFTHFNGCVRGIALLVVSAFLLVCVRHALHPASCVASCISALRVSSLHLCVSLSPCFCISPHFLSNFVTTHFITASYHTSF